MEVSEKKYVCCSHFQEGDLSNTRKGSTAEHVNNSSSSVVCSSLDYSDDPVVT